MQIIRRIKRSIKGENKFRKVFSSLYLIDLQKFNQKLNILQL